MDGGGARRKQAGGMKRRRELVKRRSEKGQVGSSQIPDAGVLSSQETPLGVAAPPLRRGSCLADGHPEARSEIVGKTKMGLKYLFLEGVDTVRVNENCWGKQKATGSQQR